VRRGVQLYSSKKTLSFSRTYVKPISFKKTFDGMPLPVMVMFFVFLLTPFLSLTFIHKPWSFVEHHGMTRTFVILAAYWVFPLSLAYALACRRYLFLPIYGLQCGALLAQAILSANEMPLDMALARYVPIAFMGYIGFFFGNKDFLFPLLTSDFRYWRKTRRIRVNYEIHLLGERPEHRVPARIRDLSSGGLSVGLDTRHHETFVKRKDTGDTIRAVVRWGGKEKEFPATIVWANFKDGVRYFGLQVEKTHNLDQFVQWIRNEILIEKKILRTSAPVFEHDVHDTALAYWVLFIALSFGLPALAALT